MMQKAQASLKDFGIRTLGDYDCQNVRLGLLLLAIVLYALWGSPTPDHPGVLEGLIAGLLVMSAGIQGLQTALHFDGRRKAWFAAGQMLFVTGLSVPVIVGAVQGNSLLLALRDIIPFIFMLIPVLYYPLFRQRPEFVKPLLTVILFAGIMSGLRASLDFMGRPFALFFLSQDDELYYLANVPTVLFASLFFTGLAVQKFVQARSLRDFLKSSLCFPLILCTILPLALTMQRASIGIFIFYTLFSCLYFLIRSPRKMIILLILVGVVFWPFISVAQDVLASLAYKTSLVGGNMRLEDLQAVWGEVSHSPLTLLFGKGWGAVFSSPAVGGVEVNFTHNLFTSFLLKTGFLGLGLAAVYLLTLAWPLFWRVLPSDPLFAMALGGPLFIDVFLYASFKSLDFGLILLLLMVACNIASQRRL